MSKELIDHGFGVIETRETYYTEQSVNELKQRITDLEAKLAESEDTISTLIEDSKASKELLKKELETYKKQSNEQAWLCEELKQQLAEKDELLKNAIIPKFKVSDRIFVIANNKVEEYFVDEVLLRNRGRLVAYRDICENCEITEKNEIFATKEEAEAKLKEIKGE